MTDPIEPPAPELDPAPGAAPVPKVYAATLGAAVATIFVTLYGIISGHPVPPGVEGAVATLVAFAAGYLAPRA